MAPAFCDHRRKKSPWHLDASPLSAHIAKTHRKHEENETRFFLSNTTVYSWEAAGQFCWVVSGQSTMGIVLLFVSRHKPDCWWARDMLLHVSIVLPIFGGHTICMHVRILQKA